MAREDVGLAQLAPHLPEPWIDVEEDTLLRPRKALAADETHDVQKRCLAILTRPRRAGDTDSARQDSLHPRRVATLSAVDERHVPAEALEAEQVLEDHPRVSAIARALGERSAECDRFGRRIHLLPAVFRLCEVMGGAGMHLVSWLFPATLTPRFSQTRSTAFLAEPQGFRGHRRRRWFAL